MSAAHNKEDLDRMLRACDEVGDLLCLKFSSGVAGETVGGEGGEERGVNAGKAEGPPRWSLEDVLACGVRDARMQFAKGVVSVS